MEPLFSRESWEPPSRDIAEIDQYISRAWDYCAKLSVDPRLRASAKKVGRDCLDLLYKRHHGGTFRQRLRIFELHGRVLAESAVEGLDWINEALFYADTLRDFRAIRRLHRDRAKLQYTVANYPEACRDLEYSLHTIQLDDAIPVHDDLTLALESVIHLATYRFFLAQFDQIPPLLHRTQDLLQQTSLDRVEAATLQSLWAHLHRWQGRPELALGPAIEAAEGFERYRRFDSAARGYCLVADVAIDLADQTINGSQRNKDLAYAEEAIRQAHQLARDLKDTGLTDLITLVRARLANMSAREISHVEQVKHVLRNAENPLLLAQAWTVLGAALGAHAEPDAALNAFRHAIDVLRGTAGFAFGIWAQRALFLYEQRIGQWWSCSVRDAGF